MLSLEEQTWKGEGEMSTEVKTEQEETLREKVEEALNSVRPHLQADGGGVELVDVNEEGIVSLKLIGACRGCPGAMMTLQMGIGRVLREQVPEVKDVQAV